MILYLVTYLIENTYVDVRDSEFNVAEGAKSNILWCALLPREMRAPFAYDLRAMMHFQREFRACMRA
jgi:hypothetical protein